MDTGKPHSHTSMVLVCTSASCAFSSSISFSNSALVFAFAAFGAGFATTPWDTWSPSFDRWIALVRERSDLRAKLDGYDEAKLLALDLDLLQQKWKKAQSAWFLPKMLNTGSVRGNLRKALPDKVKPDEPGMGDVAAAYPDAGGGQCRQRPALGPI